MAERKRWMADSDSHLTGHCDPNWRKCKVCGDCHLATCNAPHPLADLEAAEQAEVEQAERRAYGQPPAPGGLGIV